MSSTPRAVKAYVPPTYSNFGKTGIFQVYDKDSLDHTVALVNKSRSVEGLKFEPSIIYAPKANPRGQVKISFTNRSRYLTGVAVSANLQTEASKASSVAVSARNVLPKVLPGLNVTLTETTSEKDLSGKPSYGAFTTVSADYARENAALTASVVTDGAAQVGVTASAAVGFEGFAVGGDVKLIKAGVNAAFAPKAYNAGVSYTAAPTASGAVYSGALVSDAKFEKIKVVALSKKLYGYNFIDAGVQAKVDLQAPKAGAPQREVIVGIDYRATPETVYKGAVVLNTFGGVFGIEHKPRGARVALSATAVFAKPASTYSAFPITKFGVGLTVGDI